MSFALKAPMSRCCASGQGVRFLPVGIGAAPAFYPGIVTVNG
ncbi:MAG: hypothetical protein PHV02_16085 [Rhodocyclaceae bacterium]|nr:hypothetical protein [Rhodocyclaceae bacterium]